MSDLINAQDLRAVREVKVAVQIGDVRIPINAITLTHGIDQLPHVEFSAQLDNTIKAGGREVQIGAVKLDLAKFNKLNRITQAHVLDDFSVLPDCQVQVVDGDGRELGFSGFLGRPSFQFENGRLILGFTAVHAKMVLECFNGRIYQGTEWYLQNNYQSLMNQNDPSSGEAPLNLDHVSEWFLGILKQVRFTYRNSKLTPDREPLYDSVHRLNEEVWQDVEAVLNLSKDGTFIEGLGDTKSGCDLDNLYHNLMQFIIGEENIMAALDRLRNMFLLQLNATWAGKMWLEHLTMFEPAQARIQAPPQAVYYDLAHTFEPPLLQVIVESNNSPFYLIGRGGGQQFPPVFVNQRSPGSEPSDIEIIPGITSRARYPMPLPRTSTGEAVAGTYLIVDAPNWISKGDEFPMQTIEKLKNGSGNELKDVLDFYLARRKDLDVQKASRTKILDYLAEFTYKSYFLGKTRAVVTVPLIVGVGRAAVQPGRVYRVETPLTGEPMFEGYLAQVTHSVMISPEGSQATTILQFSHVRIPT